MTTVVLFLLIIIALILAGIHSWHGKSVYSTQQARDRQSSAIPVQVAVARRETVPLFISALGTVNASSTVTVRSRVDGQLMSLHFKEGDTVSAGQ